MKQGIYRVVGNREYRGHKPGTEFVARLEPGPEQRAIYRGDIRLIGHVTPDLERGTFTLPRDWLRPPQISPFIANQGAERRLLHERSKSQ